MLDLIGLTKSFRTQTSLNSKAYSKRHWMGQERVGWRCCPLQGPIDDPNDLTSLT